MVVDKLVVDRVAVEGQAVDKVAVEGLAVEGLLVDGLAVEGLAVEGLAVEEVAAEGMVKSDLLVTEARAVDNAEYESIFDVDTSDLDPMHQLPALSPLLSTQLELSPFLLKKVTRPVWFTCIQATGEPSSVPQTSTLSAECSSLSSSKLLAAGKYFIWDSLKVLEHSSPSSLAKDAE